MYLADNISWKAGDRTIVDGIKLSCRPGEFLAIVGPNGAGKSSLIRLLSGEVTPSAGEVRLDGKPVRQWTTTALAAQRAFLPQHSHVLFPFRAWEIAALGFVPEHVEETTQLALIRDKLEEAGVAQLANRIYQTLSGGEQQRVQLSRILVQLASSEAGEKYALLDEPTASLDIACQHHVFDVMKRCTQKNIGVIGIMHDLNMALQYADTIAILAKGRLVSVGHPADIISGKLLSDIYGHPIEVIDHLGSPYVISMPKNGQNVHFIEEQKFLLTQLER